MFLPVSQHQAMSVKVRTQVGHRIEGTPLLNITDNIVYLQTKYILYQTSNLLQSEIFASIRPE